MGERERDAALIDGAKGPKGPGRACAVLDGMGWLAGDGRAGRLDAVKVGDEWKIGERELRVHTVCDGTDGIMGTVGLHG